MKTQNIERYLNSFGKYIVQQSRTNLTKGKKNVNKSLYNSIKFKVSTDANGFSVKFYMNSYGTFVDKGVSGNEQKQSYKDYTGKTSSSPYKYKNKQPPSGILAKWISKKGIKGRDKKSGRFISHKSLAFIIGRKIKRDGIQGISFFQKPLGLEMKNFASQVAKAVKEDILNNLEK